MQEKIIKRIRALLAKAESTTPEEAELLTEKAQELVVKHSLDMAQVLSPGQEFQVHSRTFEWKDYKAIGKRRLVGSVAQTLPGTFSVYSTYGPRGYQSITVWTDDPMKLSLIDSLLIQAETALALWWRKLPAVTRQSETYSKKNNYLWGFGAGAAKRFEMQVAATGTEGALVLANASRRMEEYVRGLSGPLGVGKGMGKSNSGSGFAAGVYDGKAADTGGRMLTR